MDVQVKVRDGFRLSCPTGCSQAFHEEVALPCWEVNYKRRPGFAEIRKRILKFARSEMKPDSTIRDVGGLIAVKEKQKFVVSLIVFAVVTDVLSTELPCEGRP